MLDNLISEVVVIAPEEEEEDQVEILRSLTQALLQDIRRAGGTSEILKEEAATIIHYLYYTLTWMKGMMTERERCLHQAQVLEQLVSDIWRRGVPSQVI